MSSPICLLYTYRLVVRETNHCRVVFQDSSCSSSLPICGECLGTTRNRTNEEEKLSRCSGCSSWVHASCAPGGADLAVQLALGARWLCETCSPCAKCARRSDQPCLLCCALCGASHHWDCLDPPPDRRPKRPWRCRKCMPRCASRMGIIEKGVRRKYAKVRRAGKLERFVSIALGLKVFVKPFVGSLLLKSNKSVDCTSKKPTNNNDSCIYQI